MGHFMLSLVFFVSAFDLISSISSVDMFANLCLFIFLTWLCILVAIFFGNFTFNHRVIYSVFLPHMRTGWSTSIEAKSSFLFSGL